MQKRIDKASAPLWDHKPSCQEGSISPLACMVPAIDKDTHGLQIRGRKGARFPKEKMRDERT